VISGSAKGYLAVKYALAQLGKPYVFAAAGPNAFDCSGLTMAAWAAAGVALPHLASGQTSNGTAEPTDLSQAVGGDLVMIPGSDGTAANPGHVGMVAGYVDEKDGRHLFIIQAPITGVPVELTEATEWSGQITNVRHIG
jgi:cell wall-associated NlpC family hydrolase